MNSYKPAPLTTTQAHLCVLYGWMGWASWELSSHIVAWVLWALAAVVAIGLIMELVEARNRASA